MTTPTFYIFDSKHHQCVAGGDTYDGNIYHQPSYGRANATFALTPVAGGGYQIVDLKHNKCVVAGDVYDQHVYHQDPQNRPNAIWNKQDPFVDANGVETVTLVDQKHGKALVAGDVYDGNVYHQDPQGRPNARWTLSPTAQTTVCLRTYSGQYVQVDPNDNQTIVAKRDAVGGWEPLQLISLEAGRVALRASNGKYVSASLGGGGGIVAMQGAYIGPYDVFLLTDLGSGSIALQASNGQYVSCDKDTGGVPLVANRSVGGGLESFGLVKQPTAYAWETLSPNLANLSCASDGTVSASNKNEFVWNGSGPAGALPRLAQVQHGSGKQIWVLDKAGKPWRWSGSTWDQLPGTLNSLSASDGGGVWAVSGNGARKWTGSDWSVTDGTLAQIFVGAANQVYNLDSYGNVWKWNGSNWNLIPGTMKSLAIGADDGVFGLTATGGVCLMRADGPWTHLPVNLKQVTVSSQGVIFGLDTSGAVVRGNPFFGATSIDPATRVAVQEEQSAASAVVYKFSTESSSAATAAGFTQLGVAFVAHSKPQPGTVPIYKETQVANPGAQFHYWHRTDAQARSFGWVQTEVAFHAFLWPAPGTVPVYREYVKGTGSYHFSTNSAQVANQKGFQQADIAFYAYPGNAL